ncbi:MAG TPA: ribosomal-processing cysteine protease Prp [Candidatus Baltobacteraceae bacterium]|nr:ribosomal-processing cysteine protease Prp [Candidatus Baltobacteraceae bacterium]
MVEVRMETDSRGRLSAFFAGGHAGWDELGNDVVCAAVSTVLQSAWLGLLEVAKVEVIGERAAGRLSMRWPSSVRTRPDVAAIVSTAALALERLAVQFPEHLHVRRRQAPVRRGPRPSPRSRKRP